MKFIHLKQPSLFWLTFYRRAFPKIFQLQKKDAHFFRSPHYKILFLAFFEQKCFNDTVTLYFYIFKLENWFRYFV